MRIELKNIKVHEGLSEETYCYQASLYVNGKKIGNVNNRGQGGCDDFHGDRAAFDRAEVWVKENMPKTKYDWSEKEFDETLENVCHTQVRRHLHKKDMQRQLRNKALFVKPDEKGLFFMSYKSSRKPDRFLFDRIRRKQAGATILNELPADQAVELYIEHGVSA